MTSRDEIFTKVRDVLVEALGVEDDEVTPEATLVGDLGAESIDFLDIVFRLEKTFGIEIPRDEFFPEDVLNRAEYVQNGEVTATGIAELKKRMPFADLTDFERDPKVTRLGHVLKVQDMVNYVAGKVGAA